MTKYFQGRLVASTPAEAEAAIRARVREMGYEVGEIRLWPAPVQCWENMTWFEFLKEVSELDNPTDFVCSVKKQRSDGHRAP